MAQKRPPKFCWGCGAELKDSQKFCTKCGKPVSQKKELTPKKRVSPTTVPRTASFQNYGATPQTPTIAQNPIQSTTQRTSSAQYPQRTPMVTAMEPNTQPQAPIPTYSQSSYQSPQIEAQSLDNKPVLERIDNLEQKLDGFDLEGRFEKVEYKLNALFGEVHFTDQIKDLSKELKENSPNEAVNKLSDKMEHYQSQIDMKISNLATTEDISRIKSKLDTLDMNRLDNRLGKIEDRLSNFNADEKITNLAKNTVERLNSMEQKIDNLNIESRTRLMNIDKTVGKFEHRLESMNNALATLVPSLIKLTEKVNQLQFTAQTLKSDKSSELAKPSATKLDLPPFPGKKKEVQKPQKQPTIEDEPEIETNTSKDNVADIKKMLND
ncbi:zinc-ribbon domain-containing protein [Candidatus Lokiarchaeum ossiferum]|uniref:zinc-ribbon domain-containing protein n=1 Tax=Candidatus Lokiarchaeum ossiferum TaxID=2951803 RepID=UPI00352C1D56